MPRSVQSVSLWGDYNRALVQRRSFTLWFTDEAVEQWYHQGRSGGRGRECTYSGVAIQCLLVIKLPLRAMSGLAGIAGAADRTGPRGAELPPGVPAA